MQDIEIKSVFAPEYADILTPDALAFVQALQKQFNAKRLALLEKRKEIQIRKKN